MQRCIILEIKEKLLSIIKADKKTKILIVLGFVGILLIVLSEFISFPSGQSKKTESFDVATYVDMLEDETTSLIGSISGVGKCKVMITVRDTRESIYAKNSEVSSNDSSYSKNYEYVFYDGANGDEPVLIKQNLPQVQGVAIVCEGADNPVIQSQIISAISSLYNISSSKISISRLGWLYGWKQSNRCCWNRGRIWKEE